jgi:hypothetical protein
MSFSSLFVASPVAVLSTALLLCGLSGTAMSQTATPSGAATSLPNVVVEAPRQVARPPKQYAVARSTESPRMSPAAATPPASPLVQLARLESTSGNCTGGCQTSFRSGNAPWHGCSGSSGMYSSTCRNVGNYKTYSQCTEAGLITGWRGPEMSWYCTSLALK